MEMEMEMEIEMEKNFTSNKVGRKSYEYQPSLWADFFVTDAPAAQNSKEWSKKRADELTEEVRKIIKSAADTFEKMNLIDTIQRLGISYHFEKEIDEVLTSLHDAKFESDNLHEVALRFRLLRQHGFHVSPDEFLKFKDDKGEFSVTISEDARGLLSLYNAASLEINGEDMLKEAGLFAKDRLKYLVQDLEYPLKNQVSRALKVPLPRMMKRLEARWYIDEYKKENPNDMILELAILDFNMVQALHREELRIVSKWWNELNLKENFAYSRDRIVESFFWMTGVYYEPHFSRARIIATKAFNLITLLDDTHDIYGTLEELRLLTNAVQRWDRSCAETFPADYLKILYLKYINLVEETEAILEPHEKYRAFYLEELLKCFSRTSMKDAEWYAQDYSPTFKERLELAVQFSANNKLCCAILVGIGSIGTNETFEWVDNNPDPIRALAEIGRLADDMITYEREKTVGQVANLVDCYMKEHNVTKEETISKFNRWIEDRWRQVNQALLKPTAVSPVVIEMVYNFCCRIELIYNYTGDGFNKCANLKEFINLLYVEKLLI